MWGNGRARFSEIPTAPHPPTPLGQSAPGLSSLYVICGNGSGIRRHGMFATSRSDAAWPCSRAVILAHRGAGRHPVQRRIARLLPLPSILRRIERLARARRHVVAAAIVGARHDCNSGLLRYRPGPIRIRCSFLCCIALHQKRGAVRHLGNCRVDSEVPHGCGHQVRARMERRRQVEGLIAPVRQVTRRGTGADALSVHVEEEPAVSADMDDIVLRHGRQIDGLAKVKHDRLAQRRRRMRDPDC